MAQVAQDNGEAMSEIFELRQEIQQLTLRLNTLELRVAGTDQAGPGVAVDVAPKERKEPEEVVMSEAKPMDAEEKEIKLCESAWSLPAVVGWADCGKMDLLFSITLLCCNIVMQVMFVTILFDKSFLGSPFSDQVIHAQVWRTRSAHDYKHLDLADTSLVTRVCGEDNSLLVSSNQAKLISDINKFLGLQKHSFDMPFYRPGVQLCMLCIILYNLCVYKELRTVWNSFRALMEIPRSNHTIMEENRFKTISRPRLVLMLIAHAVRFSLAWALLFSGVQWLARTTSIVDLILNAVALAGILEIDEFFFVAMVPTKVQMAIQKLEPIKVTYKKTHSERESVIHGIFLLCAILLPWFLLLEPLSMEMLEVKHQMCDGIQNFVIAYNAEVQMAVGYVTTNELKNEIETLSEFAVDSFKHKSEIDMPKYFNMLRSKYEFEGARIRSMGEEAEYFPFCWQTEVLHPNGSFGNHENMTKIMQSRLNTIAFKYNMPENSTCDDFLPFCDRPDARLLRLSCGDTCGCSDPSSLPWWKVTMTGCGDFCLMARAWKMRSETECQDLATPQSNQSWHAFWDSYVDVIIAYYGSDRFEFANYTTGVVDNMKRYGCSYLKTLPHDPVTSSLWCDGLEDLFSPLSYLCPESCGCRETLSHKCPLSCALNTTNTTNSYGYSR